MRFTIDDKHLITWMWVKKLRRKTLAQDVFDRSWNLDGVKTLIKKYQYEIFNFLDLCCGVGIVWSTTTRTRVSDVTAVTFSVKCFNPWKIYPVRKHLQKVFCFILFIYLGAFNKRNHPAVRPGQSFRACPSSQSEESLTWPWTDRAERFHAETINDWPHLDSQYDLPATKRVQPTTVGNICRFEGCLWQCGPYCPLAAVT